MYYVIRRYRWYRFQNLNIRSNPTVHLSTSLQSVFAQIELYKYNFKYLVETLDNMFYHIFIYKYLLPGILLCCTYLLIYKCIMQLYILNSKLFQWNKKFLLICYGPIFICIYKIFGLCSFKVINNNQMYDVVLSVYSIQVLKPYYLTIRY